MGSRRILVEFFQAPPITKTWYYGFLLPAENCSSLAGLLGMSLEDCFDLLSKAEVLRKHGQDYRVFPEKLTEICHPLLEKPVEVVSKRLPNAPKAYNGKSNNRWIKLGKGPWTVEEQYDGSETPPSPPPHAGSELDKARCRLSKSLRKLNCGRGTESTGNDTANDRSEANIHGHPVPSGMDGNQPEVTPIRNDAPLALETLLMEHIKPEVYNAGIWKNDSSLEKFEQSIDAWVKRKTRIDGVAGAVRQVLGILDSTKLTIPLLKEFLVKQKVQFSSGLRRLELEKTILIHFSLSNTHAEAHRIAADYIRDQEDLSDTADQDEGEAGDEGGGGNGVENPNPSV